MWEIPCAWKSDNGYHIHIRCLPCGFEACKVYYNFHSVISIAMVDANSHFRWEVVAFQGIYTESVISLWDAFLR